MDFRTWYEQQESGSRATAIARRTGLSIRTIYNVREENFARDTWAARLISEATGGVVSIDALCPVTKPGPRATFRKAMKRKRRR